MITKSITYMATPDYGVGACVWLTIDGTTHVYYGEPEKDWKRDRLELTVPDGVQAGAGLFDCIEDADIKIGATFIVEGGHNDTPPGSVHTSWGDFRRLVASVGGQVSENRRKSKCQCCDTIFDEDAR
jgi:hypothetical protein